MCVMRSHVIKLSIWPLSANICSMNILVTGGAGYIGSHFCKAAAKAGLKPITIDNLSTGHEKFVKFGPFVHADIRDTAKVEKAIRDFDIQAVVHFAGKSLVGESMAQPERYYSNNVTGTLSLLNAMKAASLRTLVFSSSCATYGLAEKDTINENHPQKPINPYGRSKLFCEQMITDMEMAYGFRYAILRYFNVISEDPEGEIWEDHTPETHVVPNMIKALKEKRPFEIFGTKFQTPDGTAIRDYVDVNDLAEVHVKALHYLNQNKKLISNVGGGSGTSVRELLKTFSKVFEVTPEVVEKPMRIGDPPKLVADSSYFKSWCSHKLKSLDESLRVMKTNLGKERS